MKKQFICEQCGTIGEPRTITKGSIALELVLWLFFLLPGLIYSLWRLCSRSNGCAACGATNLIPLNTPRGQMLMKQLKQGRVNMPTIAQKPDTSSGILKTIAIGFACVVGLGVIMANLASHSNSSPTTEKTTQSPPELPLIHYKTEAKDAILKLLKTPGAAKFSQDSWTDTDTEVAKYPGTTTITVSGWVDSQNSYGALLRQKYMVSLDTAQQNNPYFIILGEQSYGDKELFSSMLQQTKSYQHK